MEKQIDEIAKDLDTIYSADFKGDYESGIRNIAEALYNAGYRKQSEGEWLKYGMWHECSACHIRKIHSTVFAFCPNCGAKMKGE